MSDLADKVQRDLVQAIDNDDLVLPTLPEVAMQIRRAAEDPEISVSNLSKVIGRDTALSARLIKVVNSPLLRATQEVTDLHTAITRLGVNYSSNLAIGLVGFELGVTATQRIADAGDLQALAPDFAHLQFHRRSGDGCPRRRKH